MTIHGRIQQRRGEMIGIKKTTILELRSKPRNQLFKYRRDQLLGQGLVELTLDQEDSKTTLLCGSLEEEFKPFLLMKVQVQEEFNLATSHGLF